MSNLFLLLARFWVAPDMSEVFLLGIKRRQNEQKTGKRGDKESSMTTQSHAPHTPAHRGLLVCAVLSGKLDLKADNF